MIRSATSPLAIVLAAASFWGCSSSSGSSFMLPDGAVPYMDGGWLLPDGNIVYDDGGQFPLPDGSMPLNDAGVPIYPVIVCGATGKVHDCADGVDNDADGKIDWADADCLGPCHNNEAGYDPAVPGGGSGTGSCTLDCYFDNDSGSGGGDCEWDVQCDPLNPGADWPGAGGGCDYAGDPNAVIGSFDCAANRDDQFAEHPTCEANCAAWTPNGCDCFGCCYFDDANGGAGGYVHIGSKTAAGDRLCSFADVDDPTLCNPCTPVASCQNECGRCELCLGRDPADLPADCGTPDAGTDVQCSGGEQPCGLPGQDPCGSGFYCLTGCCVVVPG